jgi:TPP-dependent pyruvate/acetoin dehydrogenase alpha subunit
VLLEAKTFRRKGHAEHDPAEYVPKKVREEWEAKDPLDAYTRFVIDERIAAQGDLDDVDQAIRRELDACVQEVLDSPFPDKSIALQDVYDSENKGDLA